MQYFSLKSSSGEVHEGPKIIELEVFKDERGFFTESWNQHQFNKLIGRDVDFVQDNHSKSKKGSLRGLHYQLNPNPQAKLVRCIFGEICDVIVDIRKDSSTFKQYIAIQLKQNDFKPFINSKSLLPYVGMT